MLSSILCDYSDPYLLMKGTVTITGGSVTADAAARQAQKK